MAMAQTIQFKVNGKTCKVDASIPHYTTLNAYLRYALSLPGTKAMCREGGCGACIVMVTAKRYPSGLKETFSVNSCLVLVFSCNEWEITTIEGVGSRVSGYSDAQKRIAALNGTQCGYCTPGWVMQLTSLEDKGLSAAELEQSFASNTCRCTGYRPILDTIKSFATDCPEDICRKLQDIEDLVPCQKNVEKCLKNQIPPDDTDILLEDYVKVDNMIVLDFGSHKYFKVYEENDVFDVLDKYGSDSYMLVDGNTGKGIYENFEYPKTLIDISSVQSLKRYQIDQNLILGGNTSLQDCIGIFRETAKKYDEFAYLSEFVKHFELIAHIPVRTLGSLAGNLMLKHATPAYQSDVFVLLEGVGAMLTIRNSNGHKTTLTLTDFLKQDMHLQLIVTIELPPLGVFNIFRSYKIMPRNQNALAIINAAFLLDFTQTNVIKRVRIVYGNISATFSHAFNTEQFLIGKDVFDNTVLQDAIKILAKEIVPVIKLPEIGPDMRRKLALGLFYKFILNIAPSNKMSDRYRSGGSDFDRPISKGTQTFQTDPSLYPLNQPVPKLEAQIQSSGEAAYANDSLPSKNDVYGAFVLSTVASGEVDCIGVDDVLAIDGVIALYTVKDIPGVNSFIYPGILIETEDEEVLATSIKFYGQPIAIIVARSEELAHSVAKRVKVTYKNVKTTKPVLTIDEAKECKERFIPGEPKITPTGRGNDVAKVIKGVYSMEAQYHYYMEPISCVVTPVDNRLEVEESGQWMGITQLAIARALKLRDSDVLVRVRRVGGGFGGKISRNVQAAVACALVASKLNTRCRFVLPLQTNLTIAGRRLPCQCEYEVGVNNDGRIQYLNAVIVEDAGSSNNENLLYYVVGGFPNCYDFSRFKLDTAVVLTDLPSNTSARAPGTAEAICSIEHIMEHIAFEVKTDPIEVRKINMRTDDNDLPTLIDSLKKTADYNKRAKDIDAFNKCNRWKKKAIKISLMSFPVEYYGTYSALVAIFRGDGTVMVTTGGIEMGQGSNTKVAQVCAYELGIPLEYVSVIPHYCFTAANNAFSGSSITSESVCYSCIKACKMINDRLVPIRKLLDKDASWLDIVKKAADEEVDLTAIYQMTDKEPDLESYSAFAVAIIETQLDVLTGRFQIDRADILEDVGLSANPNIDVGQVEGAYIQGLGYLTSEKLVYDTATGKLLNNRSLNYHVPLAKDIPVEFNVHLRYNSKNTKGVLGSKTCGEMGICTAHGVNHALRQCILESRKDSGYDTTQWIDISIPYDTESILRALDVKLEEFLIN